MKDGDLVLVTLAMDKRPGIIVGYLDNINLYRVLVGGKTYRASLKAMKKVDEN